jgi:hypothetical protein
MVKRVVVNRLYTINLLIDKLIYSYKHCNCFLSYRTVWLSGNALDWYSGGARFELCRDTGCPD